VLNLSPRRKKDKGREKIGVEPPTITREREASPLLRDAYKNNKAKANNNPKNKLNQKKNVPGQDKNQGATKKISDPIAQAIKV